MPNWPHVVHLIERRGTLSSAFCQARISMCVKHRYYEDNLTSWIWIYGM